ncbi:4565_t:CDS:1 [Acaulospora morrowiae]|uniref:4565_t:CDS:1 n=1 Tax=Acaulospora morrowiae TaxID=94023 RepID=A0A9N9J1L0_9GLOM|nr:4565_t:CDS:1 [Acaulospora morrowiae]
MLLVSITRDLQLIQNLLSRAITPILRLQSFCNNSHSSCLSTTIEAAAETQIPHSKIFLINYEEIDGIQPYGTLLIESSSL